MPDFDIYKPRKITANVSLYVIPQDGTFYPENAAEEADLSKVDDATWHNIAACKGGTYNQATEDDPEDHHDANTHTRVKKSNTQVTARSYEFETERYSVLFEACYHGVMDPLSAETAAKLKAGQEVPIYQSNDPIVPVGVKMELWDKGKKLLTRYFYADLIASAGQEYNGKLIRPKLTLEVSPSVWNKQGNEAQLTGETVTA